MDYSLKQIAIIVAVQGALVAVLYLARARRARRGQQTDTTTMSPHAWAWPVGIVVLFAAVLLLRRPCTAWYSSRHPPTVEHRTELLQTASTQLRCPAEQLTIEAFTHEVSGSAGAKVTGCGGSTQFCWGRTNRSGPPRWMACDLLN